VVPAVFTLMLATLATMTWQEERLKTSGLQQRLLTAQDKLILQDQIHKHELETHLDQAQARELQIDHQRRREFVRFINHDLRAPVSVLCWTISRLRRPGLKANEASDKILRLANTCDRMYALINELVRVYDQLADTTNDPDLNEYNLADIVYDCFMMQSSLAEQRESKITISISEKPAFALCNQLQLSRCIDNLIRNAVLHNDPGVHVELSLESDRTEHKIIVKDNGRGIAPEDLERIFEAGYTKNNNGVHEGLGLSIVKSFVDAMCGRITVDSRPGQGAAFIVVLPSTKNGQKEFALLKDGGQKSTACIKNNGMSNSSLNTHS